MKKPTRTKPTKAQAQEAAVRRITKIRAQREHFLQELSARMHRQWALIDAQDRARGVDRHLSVCPACGHKYHMLIPIREGTPELGGQRGHGEEVERD